MNEKVECPGCGGEKLLASRLCRTCTENKAKTDREKKEAVEGLDMQRRPAVNPAAENYRPIRDAVSQPATGDEPQPGQTVGARSDTGLERAQGRPKRIPVGEADRLRYNQRPGYYRRVVNDDPEKPGRIQEHLAAGFEFVYGSETGGPELAGDPSKMGERISKHVGGGVIGYLMEQPIEYHKEDLALRHKKINESEVDMQRTAVYGDGRYGKAEVNAKSEEQRPY